MHINNFVELQKQMEILNEEEKLRFSSSVIFLLMLYLKKQEDITPVTFIQKLNEHLNVENQKKIMDDINYIFDNYFYQIGNKDIDNPEITSKIIERLKTGKIISDDINSINSETNDDETTTDEVSYTNFSGFIPFIEGLSYIIPIFTEKAIKALSSKTEAPENISFLSVFNNEDSIMEIFEKYNPKKNLFFLITDIISFTKKGYFTFHRSRYSPRYKELKARLGEVLVTLGLISRENLEKLLLIQTGDSKMIDFENNKIIAVTTLPGEKFYLKTDRKFLGELILELELISREELDQSMNILRWYNSVFSNE